MKRYKLLCLSLIFLVALGIASSFVVAQTPQSTVYTIPTRPGVTVKTLLVSSSGTMNGILVLFVGDTGLQAFTQQGDQISYTPSFMSRTTPLFIAQGYAVLLVNAPSDHPSGVSRDFRQSSANAQDLSMIVDFLLSKSLKPIFLVGTSLGTMSVNDFASTNPKDNRISGIVLTSTVAVNLPVQNIAVPVLFVHNIYDGCSESPYASASDFSKKYTGSTKVDFIKIQDKVSDISDPCSPLSGHGFGGVENEVVRDITSWTGQVTQAQSNVVSPVLFVLATSKNPE